MGMVDVWSRCILPARRRSSMIRATIVPAPAEIMDASRYWRDETVRHHEFPVTNHQIFLAHAAVATLPRRVVQAEADFASACSERETDYAEVAKRIRAVRGQAARLLPGAGADEISLQGPTAL